MIMRPAILLLIFPFLSCPSGTLSSTRERQLQKVPTSVYNTFTVAPVFAFFPR